MKKKLLLLILVATMAFGLSGCAGGQQLRAAKLRSNRCNPKIKLIDKGKEK